jgi:hypothetical protein
MRKQVHVPGGRSNTSQPLYNRLEIRVNEDSLVGTFHLSDFNTKTGVQK